MDPADRSGRRRTIAAQLGRPPRGLRAVAHRCPCGSARRRRDRAAAAGRHAVPDALLPHLPARGRRHRHAGGQRADARDDRAAGRATTTCARATRRRTRTTCTRAAADRGRPGDRRRLGGRHARPGEVPARAGRARARRRARRQPARRRGARRCCPTWWAAGPCVAVAAAPRHSRHDARRGDRLRHQLDPAARRRHRREQAPSPTSTGGWRSSGSAQGVDRTGGSRPRRWSARSPRAVATPRSSRETGAERVRFVATSASRDVDNRDEFVAGVRAALGVEPEVITGDEEAALSFAGATRELARRRLRRRRSSSSTSAAARPSSCSAARRCRPPGRSTSAACG